MSLLPDAAWTLKRVFPLVTVLVLFEFVFVLFPAHQPSVYAKEPRAAPPVTLLGPEDGAHVAVWVVQAGRVWEEPAWDTAAFLPMGCGVTVTKHWIALEGGCCWGLFPDSPG